MSARDRGITIHRDGGCPARIGLDDLRRAGGLARHRPIIERPVIGLPVADRQLRVVGTLQLDLSTGFIRARGLRCALVSAVHFKFALGGTLCQVEIVAIAHDLVLRIIGDHTALPGILDPERDECRIAGEATLARRVVGDGDTDLAVGRDGILRRAGTANVLLAPHLEVVRGVQGRRAIVRVRHQTVVGNGHLAGELKIVVIGVVAVDAAAALGSAVPRDARVLKVELVPEEDSATVAFGAALARGVARERRVGDMRRALGLAREHDRTATVSRGVVRELGSRIAENIQLSTAILGGHIGIAVLVMAGIDRPAVPARTVVDELHAARTAAQGQVPRSAGSDCSAVVVCSVVLDRKAAIGEDNGPFAIVDAEEAAVCSGFIPLENSTGPKGVRTATSLVYTAARTGDLVVRKYDISKIEVLREVGALRDSAARSCFVFAYRPRAFYNEVAR